MTIPADNPQQVCAMIQARRNVYIPGQTVMVSAAMDDGTVRTKTFPDLSLALPWISSPADVSGCEDRRSIVGRKMRRRL